MSSRERIWLEALKEYMIDATSAAAAEHWPSRGTVAQPFYNYRLEHILQVERDVTRIAAVEHGDMDVLLAAVWIHDRYQPQFGGPQHAQKAARWAMDCLDELGFPHHKIKDVCQAILLHSRKAMDIPANCHEARIFWDADHVSRCGPVDVLNYILCHSADDFLCELPENGEFPSGAITVHDFVPLLLERRPQLYRSDWYYFDEARRMARERIQAARGFLDCLEGQLYTNIQALRRCAY